MKFRFNYVYCSSYCMDKNRKTLTANEGVSSNFSQSIQQQNYIFAVQDQKFFFSLVCLIYNMQFLAYLRKRNDVVMISLLATYTKIEY